MRTEVETFPLEEANEALDRLRAGNLRGAAVLCCDPGVPRARRMLLWPPRWRPCVRDARAPSPLRALPPGRSGLYGGGAVRDYLQFVSLRVGPAAPSPLTPRS